MNKYEDLIKEHNWFNDAHKRQLKQIVDGTSKRRILTQDQIGIDAQINMAIEEMAELISALQHYRRKETWGHL